VIGQLQGPTFTELARLAGDYFRGLLAPPGPTAEQIQDAVDRAYAQNPPAPGKDGTNGLQGEQGLKGDPCLPSDPACVGPRGGCCTNDSAESDSARRYLDQQYDHDLPRRR
jgi:hypothetical protein